MFLGTAALFALALVLGGLGPHAPLLGGLIEAAAFPLLVATVLFGRIRSIARPDCIVPVVFLLLLLALGLSQLIPLPPATWRSLPDRDAPIMVLETLGQAQRWRPLSLAPEDTRLVLQSWLPPIAIFLATVTASREERVRLALLVIAAAVLSSLLGLLQLSFGDGTLFLYLAPPLTRYPGLFANYNHQAVFLAAAVTLIPAAWGAERGGRGVRLWWPAAFWVLAVFGALITSSRAGLALFVAASLLCAVRMFRALPGRGGSAGRPLRGGVRPAVWLTLSAVALIGVMGWMTVGGYRGELMASRFGSVGADARYQFWTTTLAAIRAYFPLGAGFGVFESAYQIAEPLETVQNYLVNHAHNDYLELALEAGAGGILFIAVFVLWFGLHLTRLARRSSGQEPMAWSGALIVILVLLHSLVDYPLRTEAIGCVFAFACALLLPAPEGPVDRTRVRAPARSAGHRP